ncbi:MAG TPA: ABC transporter substrate-binding protein [Methylomirabilota bacterium]|nr:ABC transporter substrate-binding protein [Methylomirabilota bacterium]
MRRAGLALLALLVLLGTSVAAAQPRVHRIGVVLLGGPGAQSIDGLRDGLRELGFEEGKQYAFLVRDAKGDRKAAGVAAKGLEADGVDVIFAVGSSVTFTVMEATKTVPIVFHTGADPAEVGLVETFRKPGGRLTGVGSQSRDLGPKRLELLKEIVPSARRVVGFYNPDNPTRNAVPALREAARRLKIQLIERQVRSVAELNAGLRALRHEDADAIFYIGDSMVSSQAQAVVEAGLAKRLPTMFHDSGTVMMGALASYGVSFRAIGHQTAKYVHRILLGARPGDLPVELVDRIYLAINLKTAKAIGVTIPQAVLTRADEVIQ